MSEGTSRSAAEKSGTGLQLTPSGGSSFGCHCGDKQGSRIVSILWSRKYALTYAFTPGSTKFNGGVGVMGILDVPEIADREIEQEEIVLLPNIYTTSRGQ